MRQPGGNFLLNVGPQPDGQFPPEFVERARILGDWLKVHGEALYDTEPGVSEFITYGWQRVKGNNLYLIIRYWDGRPTLRLHGLKTAVKRATLMTTGQALAVKQDDQQVVLSGLPAESPAMKLVTWMLSAEGQAVVRESGYVPAK